MSKLTKNQKLALGKIEAGKAYTLKEASALVKEITTTKFDASVDVDTLDQAVHRVPHRFWFIKWGTKAIRQDIVCRNPYSQITYSEYIELK